MLPAASLVARVRNEADAGGGGGCVISPERQELIYNEVVRDAVCVRFPPSFAFRKRFLKALLDVIQEQDEEVFEPLLETYMELLQAREEREACYKTYSFMVGDEEKTITIKIAQEFHVVGLAEWEAGFYLAEFILTHPEMFRDKVCLELGSGIGLTGLVLGAVGPKQVVFTDYLEDPVLANLRLNVQNSGFAVSPLRQDDTRERTEASAQQRPPEMNVEQLDWQDFSEEQLAVYRPDYIIAADVLYDPGLVDACLKVVSQVLERNPACVALIASTIRNENTFAHFLAQAPAMGLAVTTAQLHASPPALVDTLPFSLPPPSALFTAAADAPPSPQLQLPRLFPYVRENKTIIINAIRRRERSEQQ